MALQPYGRLRRYTPASNCGWYWSDLAQRAGEFEVGSRRVYTLANRAADLAEWPSGRYQAGYQISRYSTTSPTPSDDHAPRRASDEQEPPAARRNSIQSMKREPRPRNRAPSPAWSDGYASRRSNVDQGGARESRASMQSMSRRGATSSHASSCEYDPSHPKWRLNKREAMKYQAWEEEDAPSASTTRGQFNHQGPGSITDLSQVDFDDAELWDLQALCYTLGLSSHGVRKQLIKRIEAHQNGFDKRPSESRGYGHAW